MKIYVIIDEEKKEYNVPNPFTVKDLKEDIRKREKINNDITIFLENEMMEDDKLVNETKVYHISEELVGGNGGIGDLKFSDMKELETISYSQSALAYRIVTIGINLEGSSESHKKDCLAKGKQAFYRYGYEKEFVLGRDYLKLKCPLCQGVPTKDEIQNFTVGFSKCSWEFYGVCDGVEKQRKGVAKDEYQRFKSGEGNTAFWSYLMFKATPLK